MKKGKIIFPVIVAAAIIFSLYGCTEAQKSSDTSISSAEQTTQPATVFDSDMFTDRDYDEAYDENSAVKINLSDKKIECISENVEINDNTVTIKTDGTYIISGSLGNGQITVDADDTAKIQIVLNGVNINCDTSAAVYIKQAAKVFITLADGTDNILSNKKEYDAIDENNIDSVLFSKEDITINGSGKLEIKASYGHGIVSKKDLKIISGTYIVDANDSALQGKNSIRVAGGVLNLVAVEDGMHSENNDENNEDKGFIYIIAGAIDISAGDDGIHAGKSVTIKGGTVNISKSNEGIEGETINISGGDITVKSEDDGINASGEDGETNTGTNMKQEGLSSVSSNCDLIISGGIVRVDSEGDGLDSNGSISVTGGKTYIEGPTKSGNAALDYETSAEISGGTFIAIGPIGMAQNFSDGSTQCTMLVNAEGSAGDKIVLKNSSGDELLTYEAGKSYTCVVISCPEITQGETYTVTSNNEDIEITMTETVYSSQGAMGMNGKRQMGNDFGKGGNIEKLR